MYINEEGHLIAEYIKEGETMKEDLGLVIPQFTASTTTGAAGSNASVTATNTNGKVSLAFSVPRGATGATGAAGADGKTPTMSINAEGHLIATYPD